MAILSIDNLAHRSSPKPGQIECGDQCGAWIHGDKITLALADGLGHGPHAAIAANAAIAFIERHLDLDLEPLFNACNDALRNTRGVALAVAIVDQTQERLTLASVGNIRAALLQGNQEFRLGGCAGIVGGDFKRLAPDMMSLHPGDRLVLYSDGLPEFLALQEILAALHDPSSAVETLVEQYASGTDDVAAVAYFHGRPG